VDPRKKTPQRVASIVRDVDLAPTLAELAGLDAATDVDGVSLAPAIGGAAVPPLLAYAETGLWFTTEIPGLPDGLRLPYPNIGGLTEIDPEHGDEIMLQKGMRPITVVAKHRMVRDDRWKLVYAPTRAGARFFLFDTAQDPGETRDIAAEHPAEVTRLKNELFGWMLRDRDMRMQGEFLVPRDVAALAPAATGGSQALRLPGTP
jgi:arylsulfatase A-like enzyme